MEREGGSSEWEGDIEMERRLIRETSWHMPGLFLVVRLK